MPLLTCPHCGSALTAPEAETAPLRCPVCGAPLVATGVASDAPEALPIREAIVREEEDASATRAVAPERMAPIIAQATTDHLNTRSAEIPSIVARPADETTQALPFTGAPAPATEAREVTQELPPAAQPVTPTPPPETSAQRPRGSALRAISLMLAALVLVAVVVVAALAANGVIGKSAAPTAQATSTSTPLAPTATPALNVFGVQGLYSVTYPQGWLIQQRNTPPQTYFALLTAPSGGASVNIEAQQSNEAPDVLDQRFLTALAQPGTTPKSVGAPVHLSFAGAEWVKMVADMTLRTASGQPAQYARVVAYSTRQGDYAYTIVCLAPSASEAAAGPAFTTANTTYFQPLLTSFTFLS